MRILHHSAEHYILNWKQFEEIRRHFFHYVVTLVLQLRTFWLCILYFHFFLFAYFDVFIVNALKLLKGAPSFLYQELQETFQYGDFLETVFLWSFLPLWFPSALLWFLPEGCHILWNSLVWNNIFVCLFSRSQLNFLFVSTVTFLISERLRFFSKYSLFYGILCLIHVWNLLPPKPTK